MKTSTHRIHTVWPPHRTEQEQTLDTVLWLTAALAAVPVALAVFLSFV